MDATQVRSDFLHEVQKKQWKKRWLGARVTRVGLLYDVVAEDVEGNTLEVVDVAHDQRERWSRDQFLAIGLKVEREPGKPTKEETPPIKVKGTVNEVKNGIREGLSGLLGKLLGG